MRTQEQILVEVRSYLEKTSNHVFVNEKGSMFAIKVLEGNKFLIFENDKVRSWDYTYLINGEYTPNAKCVLSHMLFLNKGYRSIKKRKPIREQLNQAFTDFLSK